MSFAMKNFAGCANDKTRSIGEREKKFVENNLAGVKRRKMFRKKMSRDLLIEWVD
jgi:hypothetical protein